MSDHMRLLVTGSRDWDDEVGVRLWLTQAWFLAGEPALTLVSGACPTGADRMAEKWAESCSFTVERHPALWALHGKAAGPLRNAEMVALGADACLAFIRNGSKGATLTADLAEQAGIPTTRFTA